MRKMTTTLVALASLFTATVNFADTTTGTDDNDVILAGHDAVAYFTENRPVPGSADFTVSYDGAIYRFASAANRDRFRSDPARYAPVYGGYCAFGTSIGKKFQVDGQAFEVVDGRLYVNKNLKVYGTWRKDIPGNIAKADGHWPKIRTIPADQL
ncbi:MAG: YHS domain-containing (seleno)protein [Gammaproteobacteria bacterium]